jgi:hypothetical protein
VHRYGSEREALRVLSGENYDFRDRERARSQEIEGLRAKQVPDGALVLTGDDLKAWQAIKALNVPVTEVAPRVKEAGELKERQQQADRRKAQDSAAASLKWNADVLAPLLDTNKLDIELRDVVLVENGKEISQKRPYVRKAGDASAAWEKLDELVARDASLKNFLPALKVVPATGAQSTNGNGAAGSTAPGSSASSSSSTTAPANGNVFSSIPFPVEQGSSSGDSSSAGVGLVDKFIERSNKAAAERPNPFRRPQSGTANSGSGNASGATR